MSRARRIVKKMPLCINCSPDEHGKGGCVCEGKKLTDKGVHDTDWYGKLHYYKCRCCEETLVSQDGHGLEIAAIRP